MLDESRYIEEVWHRYHEYCRGNLKNDFYEKRIYRQENNVKKILKMVAMITLCITTTFGVVYAGIAIYNNYIKSTVYVEFDSRVVSEKWLKDNMKQAENEEYIYYSEITNYEEYLKYKKVFNNIEELNESDFANNFAVLICGYEVDIEEVSTKDDELYISFKMNDRTGKATANMLMLSKEQYRDNIKLARIYERTTATSVAIEDIPVDYSREQAINDGYIVADNESIISNNKDMLYEFVEKTKNGEDGFIRIIDYNKENDIIMEIKDLEYKNGEYIYNVRIVQDNKEAEFKYRNQNSKEIKISKEGNKENLILIIDNEKVIEIIKF